MKVPSNHATTSNALGRAHLPPTNHASLLRQSSITSTWDFPDVIKFRVAVHTLWEKAIRFRHSDYDPDRAQKLISSPMCRHLSTRNVSSKSMHSLLSNLANRQTDKHRGQSHLPPPLSEVNTLSTILRIVKNNVREARSYDTTRCDRLIFNVESKT